MPSKEISKKNSQNPEWIEIPSKPQLPTFNWMETDLGSLESLKVLQIRLKLHRKDELENLFNEYKKYIRELPHSWDGYGAPPIVEATLERTLKLLKKIYETLWNEAIEISPPMIQPVPDGSIDINWETSKFELLINIPQEQNELVNLYGEKIGYPQDELEVRSNYDLVSKVVIEWFKKIH